MSCGESLGIFELDESALDHVAQGVGCGIDRKLVQAITLGRDHRGAAALLHVFANKASIRAFVGAAPSVRDRRRSCPAVILGNRKLHPRSKQTLWKSLVLDAEMDFGRKATSLDATTLMPPPLQRRLKTGAPQFPLRSIARMICCY